MRSVCREMSNTGDKRNKTVNLISYLERKEKDSNSSLAFAFLEKNVVFMRFCEFVQSLFPVVTILAFFKEPKKEI